MTITARSFAFILAIAAGAALTGQEPKKEPAKELRAIGDFKSIDRAKKTISIESGFRKKEVKSYPLADSVEVLLRLKPDVLKLTDLLKGDQLMLTIDPETKKVIRISVEPVRPRGTIKEIDVEKKIIVIGPTRGEGPEFRLPLAEKVTIEKYYRTIPLGDVKPGMSVFTTLGDDRKAVIRMTVSERNGPRSIVGRIQALDVTKRTITIVRPTSPSLKPVEPVTYKVADNAAIKLSGTDSKLIDLATGIDIDAFVEMDIIIGLSDLFSTGRHGTIAKVDVKASTVSIKVYDETITCVVNVNTKIRQARKDIALADLKEGQEVIFMLSADKKTAESIFVTTTARP